MPNRRRFADPDPDEPLPHVEDPTADAWEPSEAIPGFDDEEAGIPAFVGAGVPAVVAVMVTRDPGPTLEASLEGLADQDYANLSVLVVDAGSREDPTPRVAALLPNAFVKRMDRVAGFGEAANAVFEVIEGATFYLFVHDDAQLAPGAVQSLVAEAFRANAGIVGAKLVDWDHVDLIRSVGAGVDKFGFQAPLAEPGERDQAQHDAPREVFVVSTAAMLVRADLFGDLGGFATDLAGFGEELDLCWRARVSGARTVVQPLAVARHRELSAIADPDARSRRLALRHQARVMLASYSPFHLARVVPQAILYSIFDVVMAVLSGRLQHVGDVVGAWTWNLGHVFTTLRLRGRVKRARRVPDSEVRRHQVQGSARLSAYLRGARSAGERRIPAALAVARDLPNSWQEGAGAVGAALAVVVALIVLIGSRGLFSTGIPALRQFAPLDGTGALMREWWSGWRTTGLGQAAAAPSSIPVAWLLSVVTFGHSGLARMLLVVGPVPLGVWGAWRLLRGAGSTRARLIAALAYVVNPLPYDAIANGRLHVLAVYAALPWIVGRLARASGEPPFDDAGPRVGRVPQLLRAGLVVGLAASFAPEITVITLAVAAAMALALALAGRTKASGQVLGAGIGATVVAAVIQLPVTVGLITGSLTWSGLTGTGPSTRALPDLWDVVRLSSGPTRGGVLFVGLAVAAAAVVLVGRDWRLRWGAVAWTLVLLGWVAAIVVRDRGWDGPVTVEVLLVVAAVGLVVAIGLGVDAFTTDVMGGTFGWRQLASGVAAVAFVAALLPMLLAVTDGRWHAPQDDAPAALSTLQGTGPAQFRTLWLGDRDTLPTGGWDVDRSGLVAAVTDGVRPTLGTVAPPSAGPGDRRLIEAVRAVLDADSHRLGRLLSPFSVRYVVVMADGNPTGSGTGPQPGGVLATMLSEQLDLVSVDIAPGMLVFENDAAMPKRAQLISGSPAPTADGSLSAVLAHPTPAVRAVLGGGSAPTSATGAVRTGPVVFSSNRNAGWQLTVDGRVAPSTPAFGWGQQFAVSRAGAAELRYDGSTGHRILLIGELVAVVVLVAASRRRGLAIRHRRPAGRDVAEVVPAAHALREPQTTGSTPVVVVDHGGGDE